MAKTYYITTPIYYPSDNLHIGHAYTTVAADALCRYKAQRGYDTYFLTGTDEHGQKIAKKAKEAGLTPKEFVDGIVANIKKLWETLDIEYNDYIRTTDERHAKTVQKIFEKLYNQGDIYKGEYNGLYCTSCEAFFTEHQATDGKCPDCGKHLEQMKEEAYFLKLSKYQDWLIDYIESHPDFIQPVSRKNEMVNNFLKPGLEDLCVSRTSVKWGIPVTFAPEHTVYVWLDALSNYISALGYTSDNHELFDKYWPADLHLVGKEIIRFHTIIWPIILHALDLPMPKQIFGHGWLIMNGEKMSKSIGNVIDPFVICDKYGADTLRYYLLRAIPFGSDGQFTFELFLTLINADLANTFGNLVSRTSAMIEKYFDGKLPAPNEYNDVDKELIDKALKLPAELDKKIDQLLLPQALEDIMNMAGDCNKYIDITEPWILGKTEEGKHRLATVLYVLAECIRFISVLLEPFMPSTPQKIYEQFGIDNAEIKTLESLSTFGKIKPNSKVTKGKNLFPRIDIKAELSQLVSDESNNKPSENNSKKETKENSEDKANLITIDDFDKVQLKIGRVISCEKVEKSDKLLKFELDFGNERRTIISGIAKYYNPEELVNKQLVVCTNLAPRKLRGIVSEGMILSALQTLEDGTEKLNVLTVEGETSNGAIVG